MKLPWQKTPTAPVVEKTYEPWSDKALKAVHSIAMTQSSMTSDDVWAFLSSFDIDCTTERRSMGGVMRTAVAKGWIRATPYYRVSKSPATRNHGRPQRVYESRVVQRAPLHN